MINVEFEVGFIFIYTLANNGNLKKAKSPVKSSSSTKKNLFFKHSIGKSGV